MECRLTIAENSWLVSEIICKTYLLRPILGIGLQIVQLQSQLLFSLSKHGNRWRTYKIVQDQCCKMLHA